MPPRRWGPRCTFCRGRWPCGCPASELGPPPGIGSAAGFQEEDRLAERLRVSLVVSSSRDQAPGSPRERPGSSAGLVRGQRATTEEMEQKAREAAAVFEEIEASNRSFPNAWKAFKLWSGARSHPPPPRYLDGWSNSEDSGHRRRHGSVRSDVRRRHG